MKNLNVAIIIAGMFIAMSISCAGGYIENGLAQVAGSLDEINQTARFSTHFHYGP